MRSLIFLSFLFATSCVDAQTKLYDPAWFDDGSLETEEQWSLVEGHAVLFFAWAVREGLVRDEYPYVPVNRNTTLPDGRAAGAAIDEEYRRTLTAIRERRPDALSEAVWLVENGMTTRNFSQEGAEFAASCFSVYRSEYPRHLGLLDGAGVRATWESYGEVAPLLDSLFESYKAGGCA
ncbi:MAG: hypothetical protein AAF845_09510 [Bacteroidota bacterium]